MSFEMKSESDILTALKADLATVSNGQSTVEGSFNSDMLTANAVEFEQAYAEMQQMIQANFATTSWGDYLTSRASEYGVVRKEATAATGIINIMGTAGSTIIQGSLFATNQGVDFYTTAFATIGADGTASINIQCSASGTVGNVAAGLITKIPMSIPGVTSCTNATACQNGFDEETDAELLARYLLKVRTPATSGNKYHYQQWALSVAGIGQAKVLPLWNGNGSIKVIIVDSNNATANATLIQNVADYIETVRPIGATVTVTSPAPYPIDIYAEIIGVADTDTVKTAINNYFNAYGFTQTYISFAQIGKILLDTAIIKDYKNLIVCGGTGNVPITEDQIPICGTVKLNVYS